MIKLNTLLKILLFFTISIGYSQNSSELYKNTTNEIKGKPIKVDNWKSNVQKNRETKPEVQKTTNRNNTSFSAGTTNAEFSVSLSGSGTYNIPITTPPGVRDINPNIGLTFNTQASNGLAGWGWNISGLSTISRVASTKFHDECIDGVDFDEKDRFSLDGQRLILKSGTYGANGSVYSTERYNNIKIVANGQSSFGGPSNFIVYYPNGSRSYFGHTFNSFGRLEWALWKKLDAQGNEILYYYSSENNIKNIDKITFGSVGSHPIEIKFYYKLRSRPELSYVNGIDFKRTSILERIEVKANSSLYRKYAITHDETSLGYERVISVQEFNRNNEGLAPINFIYENSTGNNNLIEENFSGDIYPRHNSNNDLVIAGEFSGDDRTDFIKYNKNTRNKIHLFDNLYDPQSINIGIEYDVPYFDDVISNNMLNSDNKLLSQQGITFIKESINTNGVTSTVNFDSYYNTSSGSVTGALSYQYTRSWNTGTYSYTNYPGNVIRKKIPKKYISGDFNGDGLTDVLAIGTPYSNRYCSVYDCRTLNSEPTPKIIQQINESDEDFKIRIAKDDQSNNSTNTNKLTEEEIPDDEGGNCYTCSTYTVQNKNVYFFDLNTTLTTSNATLSNILEKVDTNDRLIAADFNGDGKSDLFHFKEGEVFIYELDENNKLSLIHSEPNSSINLNRPILMGDYNGDGKIDFLTPTSNDTYIWKYSMSKGNVIFNKTETLSVYYRDFYSQDFGGNYGVNYFSKKYIPIDFNGDGKTDLISHFTRTAYISYHGYWGDSTDIIKYYSNGFNQNNLVPSFNLIDSVTETNNDNTSHTVLPIFLDTDLSNENLEYVLIKGNNLRSFKLNGNHKKDISLKQIINNGLTHQIEYFKLNIHSDDFEGVYNGTYDQVYPFVNVNIAPSFNLIGEVREIGSGITRTQNYKYRSAITHMQGLGFIGFKQVHKSNWQGDGVQRLWTISESDPQKRGAINRSWLSLNSFDTPYNFINKTDYTYNTILTSDKIFINVPTQVSTIDNLSGITKTETYSYDSFYNPTEVVTNYPNLSKLVNYTYSNNITSNNYNYHVGRTLSTIETNTINGNSFTTEEQYTYDNNLLTQTKKRANGSAWLTETNAYDSFGNVITKTLQANGVLDRVEHFEYDTSGRYMLKSIDIEGLETATTYDISTGNPLTITNPYGLVTNYLYDDWQRVIKETNYLGKDTYFTYQNSGSGGLSKTVNLNEGQDIKTYYNAFGWVTKESALSLNNKWINKEIIYDAAGRKQRVSEPYFSTNSASQWNYYFFDEYGRSNSQQLYTGKIITTTYNGTTVTVDDGTKTISKTSDAIGNVISVTDPGGTITYQYFGNGALKSANYDNHSVTITIDEWGRKKTLNDPSVGLFKYDYSILGEILQEITPKGVTNYSYDGFGKVTSKQVVGDKTNLSLNYVYNTTTKLISQMNGYDSENSSSYNYGYVYDNYKRLKKVFENTDDNKFHKTNTYDDFGRIHTEKYETFDVSSGTSSIVEIKMNYDTAGILINLRDLSNNSLLWQIQAENARQQATSIALGNGITKTKQYDQFGLLTNITDVNLNNSVTALKADYSFNAVRGILTNRKNYGFNNWEEAFTYDDLDRLTDINGAVNHSQIYDNRGRITTNSFIGEYSYDNTKKYQLAEVDLNNQGDLYYQQHNLQQITYNAFKKPVDIYEESKGRVSFEYGPLMNRTHAYYGGLEEDPTQRNYHKKYSSIMPVEVINDAASQSTKIITYIGGDAYTAPIAHIKDTNTAIDEFHYLHRDYLSSILAITDVDGEIKEERQFGAWGIVDKFVNDTGNIEFTHNSLLGRGYTGHEHFFEVSLIHMNGRMYDAKLGRFLSPDNFIQDPYNTQSFNRYTYVWNNPLSFNDPSGEIIVQALIGAAISVVVNGIVNSINGEAFFKGAIKSAIIGGIGGAFSYGIGDVVKGMDTWARITTQAFAHGHLGGMMSSAMGGSYGAGFLSGAIASTMSAGVVSSLGDGVKSFWGSTAVIATGGLSGGIGSSIAGGNFWNGVRNGLISSTLNHLKHAIQKVISINNMLKEAELKARGIPEKTLNYINNRMVDKIKFLKEYLNYAGKPILRIDLDSGESLTARASDGISLGLDAFSSNYRLLSTIFHEAHHFMSYNIPKSYLGGNTIDQWANENIGNTSSKFGRGYYFLEMQAYGFQIGLGDTNSTTLAKYNEYRSKYLNYGK